MMQKRTSRLIDFVVYLVIGFSIVAFAAVYAVHAVRSGGDGRLPLKWVGLVASTLITFGYALRWSKPSWRLGRVWLVLAGLLVVHTAIFVVVLLRVERWPLIYFPLAEFPAFFVICFVLNAVNNKLSTLCPGERLSHAGDSDEGGRMH